MEIELKDIINFSYGAIMGLILVTAGNQFISIESYWIFYFLLPLACGSTTWWTGELSKLKYRKSKEESKDSS